MSGHLLSKVTRTDPALLQYTQSTYGTTNLSDEDWKKAEDNYKVFYLNIANWFWLVMLIFNAILYW